MKTILFFTGEEWSPYSQRTQSLAISLAHRGYDVVYIEPMISAGKLLRQAVGGKLRQYLANVSVSGCPNLRIAKPYFCFSTFRGGVTPFADRIAFNVWLSSFVKQEVDYVYINLPYWWNNIISRSLFPGAKIVYDCIDDCRVYSRNDNVLAKMEAAEQSLATAADLVIATASKLHEKMLQYNENCHLISNGVDTGFFMSAVKQIPADLASIPRPILGFVGALYHWIDVEAFRRIAQSKPDASIVLVGPKNNPELDSALADCPNMHYLGPKPYTQVPAYMNSFDICLNPFKMDEIGDNVNPLKMYEYLCLGKPIVSSRTKEMEQFHQFLHLYSDYDQLLQVLEAGLLRLHDAELSESRMKFASENSWENKTELLVKLLEGGQ